VLLSSAVVELAVDGVHIADGAFQLVLTGAIALDQLLALQLEADSGKGIAGKALHAVHSDGEDGGFGKAISLRSCLHGGGSDDAAGQRRQTGNHQVTADNAGQNDQAQRAHTGKASQAHNDGLPLGYQLLDGNDRAHVGDKQVNADGAAKGDQHGVAYNGGGNNSPEAYQKYGGGDENRWDPGLRQV